MGYAFENTPWHLVPDSEKLSIWIMQAAIRDGQPTIQERYAAEFAKAECRG